MKTVIINAIILSPSERLEGYQVVIEGGRIAAIESGTPPEAGSTSIDAQCLVVAPGLIDLHVHGVHGYDTMDATPEALHQMGRFMAQHGVTSYLPTTLAAAREDTLAAIENVARTSPPLLGAQHLGVHLEGPFLNTDWRGAQPAQHLRPASRDEYDAWLRTKRIRLITVAPEVEGVLGLLDAGRSAGIEFAIGHSGATFEQVLEAIEHGLHQVTHTFNGMPPLHHRSPGVLGAALGDTRLRCQVIADGVHVHPAVVKLLAEIKGAEGTILITDATRATGMPDGDYPLGDGTIHVSGGVARTQAGGLAGSTLTMDQALRNLMKFANLSLQQALPMATATPAAAIGLAGRKGSIEVGADADLIVLDDNYQVRLTMVDGHVVYDKLNGTQTPVRRRTQ